MKRMNKNKHEPRSQIKPIYKVEPNPQTKPIDKSKAK